MIFSGSSCSQRRVTPWMMRWKRAALQVGDVGECFLPWEEKTYIISHSSDIKARVRAATAAGGGDGMGREEEELEEVKNGREEESGRWKEE